MESQNAAGNDIFIISNPKADIPSRHDDEGKMTRSGSLKKESRRGSKNIFKVAFYMIRGGSRKPKAVTPADVESQSAWKKLVGSMRPLHLPANESPPPNNKMITLSPSSDDGFDSASELPSPSSSRYASAVGLNEMVKEEEENVANENNGNGNGNEDEMIDAKADEFIAQFYKQMRLQQLDVVDPRYKEISMRSLGL